MGCGVGIYETQEDVVVIFRLVKFLLSFKLDWARRISITPGMTKGKKKSFWFCPPKVLSAGKIVKNNLKSVFFVNSA